MTSSVRLPAIKLLLKPHVINEYRNPFALKRELARCKKIDSAKIKFAKIVGDANLLMIATDDEATHAELNKPWPLDAFTAGVNSPKPKDQSIRATAHHIPVDILLTDPEVTKELEQQGITLAHRRVNKTTNKPTEYVTIFVKSKQALNQLINNKLKLALCRYRVSVDEKIIQCFKCQKVGHTAANCTNPTICLRCGGDHSHKDCTAELKCANCQGQHAACARKCPLLKPAPKPTQATKTTNQLSGEDNNNNAKGNWSSVVANNNQQRNKQQQQHQVGTTSAQVQQLIDQAIETKIKPFLEILINLTTELTLLLSHREVFSLPNTAKIDTASKHISNATNYKVNQESILQSVRSLICDALQAAQQPTTQSQLPQQPAHMNTQKQQQSKRKSRSPSISSSYDPSIHDLNNTNMDAETSVLQTPNDIKVTSSITVAKSTANNASNRPHNSSGQPQLKRLSTSTLLNSTISQRNKETIKTNNV